MEKEWKLKPQSVCQFNDHYFEFDYCNIIIFFIFHNTSFY